MRLPEYRAAVGGIEEHRRHGLACAEHEEAADVRLRHQRLQSIEGIGVGRHERRLERRHQQLPDLLVNRQRRHRLLHPATGGLVERWIGGCQKGRAQEERGGAGERAHCANVNIRVVVSSSEHRREAPASVAVHIVTVSDTRTPETDSSGRLISALLEERGHRVSGRTLLKDEPGDVRQAVTALVNDSSVDVVITTGGTGITARDSTFEAIDGLLQKRLAGFGELFRMLSYHEIGAAAMLSRATAGLAGAHRNSRATRLRARSQAGDGEARLAGAGPPRARGTTLMGYRPDRKTIPIDEARAILAVHGEPVSRTERVAVPGASGRVVSNALIADRDVPPFARAAMDGFAVPSV